MVRDAFESQGGHVKVYLEEGEEAKLKDGSIYEGTFRSFQEGEIVSGVVVAIHNNKKEVLVDFGYKSEGILKLDEFTEPSTIQIGMTLDVLLESREDDEGMVIVSKKKADRMKCWNELFSNMKEGDVVEGRIFKKVRGGFMVDIGMEAFLPASLVALKPTKNPDQFLGQTCKFKIVKMNSKRKNVVLSRKDFLENEKAEARTKMLGTIQVGQVVRGRVKNITDFGAFIDLGGVDGLLHVTDMSWGRISHPSEVVTLNQDLDLMVIGFDPDTHKISLGLKQRQPSPWDHVAKNYPVNTRVRGKVVNILPYGAFVEIEKGVEGLVHISELSWTRRVAHPSEMLKIGDQVECIVLSCDRENKKIALGIKQIESNPWLDVEQKYHAGDVIEGKVRNLTDYGVFVELEPGIGGLVHVSDISWFKKINNPGELFKNGDGCKVKILSIDAKERKISLGIKQLFEDPWQELPAHLAVGATVSGKVTKIVNFGLFVELPGGFEGLVHISKVGELGGKSLEETFKVGQNLEVGILKIDEENRKIALTLTKEVFAEK
ncbi:MAG: 30S ribosomal protein S1 [Candidatus Omnitrophica bacterium]|nr:30S ribosomal protein S1 [Candidatus Omnitrophota bacterium]